ncbi:hypothetical protein LCGC14_1548000 [marine sediment metagenome]|uniref:Uncharacterized protein n=1 Tax=marine sediment metagenome TaxID=412755 RepID=A0A0F9IR69_9ZZZZ
MVEVLVKNKVLEESLEEVEIVFLEELPVIEADNRMVKVRVEENPIKKALLKLFKKARYNPKYIEEEINIVKAKKNTYYRNYGLYGIF